MTPTEIVTCNIRREREAQRMSRSALASRTGLSPGYIEAVENGRRIPSLLTLDRIAKALGVTTSDLLREV
jgi:transcriptional regulator with XRE-family HTH domain